MDVILDRKREGVVDDCGHIGDVQTTGGNIGRDEQRCCAGLELLQSVYTCGLRHVAVQAHHREALATQHALDPRCLFLVKRKYQDTGIFGGAFALFG